MPAVLVRWARAGLLFIALGLGTGLAGAQDLQPVPALTGHIIDTTGTLDEPQRQGLEARLATFERDKGTQLVLLMVATTQPEDIASYANRVGNAWKIGRKDVGDGVLLVVAKNDRKVRIEVAKTLEGAVPDLAARQIIDDAITPRFRQGDFAGGLGAAAEQLIARISGEALPAPAPSESSRFGLGDGADWFEYAAILVFAIVAVVPVAGGLVRLIFGRKLGAVATGGGIGALGVALAAPIWLAVAAGVAALLFSLLSGNGGSPAARGRNVARRGRHGGRSNDGGWGGGWSSGGGSGGSSSGGGFSSGGGGDFGGGGASGDW